ncbi:hypothetical protein [Streptomyces scabiei]|uniref:hypothetical protein n=1 Tax=Streptomyces scabiei TaxID=1930 RepID=UPI00117C3F55|nr:hypothetical protein [Streptomyces scabiei]
MTTTARTTRGEGIRYRVDRPTFAGIMRDLRIPGAIREPGTGFPASACRQLTQADAGRVSPRTAVPSARLRFTDLPGNRERGAGLLGLHRTYGDAIRFVVVNVREAHPGADTPQPRMIDEKTRHARALRSHHGFGFGFGFEVAVDGIDGIDGIDGTVLFRSLPSERRVAPTVAITSALCAAAVSAGLLVLR